MKKSLLLISTLMAMYLSQGQSYMALPDTNASWTFYSETWSYIYVNGQSIINFHYSPNFIETTDKVILDGQEYIECSNGKYYREENKKVYEYVNAGNPNRLLYDFNLTTGDTLQVLEDNLSLEFIVQSEDSILIDSVYHRVQDYGHFRHIEGVGSDKGLFYTDVVFGADFNLILTCFENPSGLYVVHADSSITKETICTSTLGIEQEVATEGLKWEISNNQIYLSNIKDHTDISIFNILGKPIFNRTISESESIEIDQLENGIYLAKITSGNHNITSFKFIKQ